MQGVSLSRGGHIIARGGNVRVWIANPFSQIATTIYMAAQDKIENLTIKSFKLKLKDLSNSLLTLIVVIRRMFVLSENTVQSLGSFVGGLLLTVLLAWLAIADRVPVVSAKNALQGCTLLSSVKKQMKEVLWESLLA